MRMCYGIGSANEYNEIRINRILFIKQNTITNVMEDAYRIVNVQKRDEK